MAISKSPRRSGNRRSLSAVKILLLQLKRIGDLIMTTPAIEALRKNFPQARITLVVSRECAELLPAISSADRTLVANRNLRDVAVFLTVAREKFDYCIDFTQSDRSALLAFLSRAQKRVAAHRVKDNSGNRARVYNEFTKLRLKEMHTLDYNLALLEPLGIGNASRALHLEVPRSAREKAELLLEIAKIGNPFIIFHPGSARAEKFWDARRWADVIGHVRSNRRINCVLTGGGAALEQKHLSEIKARLRRPLIDLSRKTDLLTLTALIAQARLLVTVDSAPMHLAAAIQTPQVVLFGPTNPFHWRPRESPAMILQGESARPMTEFFPKQKQVAMKEISTEAVINAMDLLLSAPAAQTS
jgi:predicted lipopolysaccharide heptosyltransferase III